MSPQALEEKTDGASHDPSSHSGGNVTGGGNGGKTGSGGDGGGGGGGGGTGGGPSRVGWLYNVFIVIGYIAVIVAAGGIIYLLYLGFSLAFLDKITPKETGRALITFLFGVSTVGIAVIIVIGAFLTTGTRDELSPRFQQANSVLASLVGVFGTIVGFYFGTPSGGNPQDQNVAKVTSDTAQHGGSTTPGSGGATAPGGSGSGTSGSGGATAPGGSGSGTSGGGGATAPGVGGGSTAASATALSSSSQKQQSLLQRVQQQLLAEGYYKGAVDGQWGSLSQQAMQQFQRAKGLPITGQPDLRTLGILSN